MLEIFCIHPKFYNSFITPSSKALTFICQQPWMQAPRPILTRALICKKYLLAVIKHEIFYLDSWALQPTIPFFFVQWIFQTVPWHLESRSTALPRALSRFYWQFYRQVDLDLDFSCKTSFFGIPWPFFSWNCVVQLLSNMWDTNLLIASQIFMKKKR